jgi:hypothetical protein
MPVARFVFWRVLPLSVAGLLLLAYTCLHFFGLMILMNRITGVLGFVMFFAPLFAFPIYLVSFWSRSKASALLLVNFLIVHICYVLAAWPDWGTVIEALRIDWPLIAGALLLWLTAKKWSDSALPKASNILSKHRSFPN